MIQQTQVILSGTRLIKALKKSVKQVVTEQGINPATRSGDKELELLVKKIARQPLSLEQVQHLGEQIGNRIVEISQQKGKKDLDRGVIREIALNKELLSPLTGELSQPLVARQAKSVKSAQTVIVPPKATKIKPVPPAEAEISADDAELEPLSPLDAEDETEDLLDEDEEMSAEISADDADLEPLSPLDAEDETEDLLDEDEEIAAETATIAEDEAEDTDETEDLLDEDEEIAAETATVAQNKVELEPTSNKKISLKDRLS